MRFIEVVIGNSFDDSNESKFLCYDNDDINLENYLNEIVECNIKLCSYNNEYIISINKIKPLNISTTKELYNKTNNNLK